jgi:hypothetical protein
MEVKETHHSLLVEQFKVMMSIVAQAKMPSLVLTYCTHCSLTALIAHSLTALIAHLLHSLLTLLTA